MAKFEWNAPISAVHGRLWKGMGAAKRKLANADGEQPNYSVFYGKRTTEATQDEVNRWNRFGTIAAMVAMRRKDISKRISDIMAYKAQSTYKTFTSYLWSICTAQYNTEHADD